MDTQPTQLEILEYALEHANDDVRSSKEDVDERDPSTVQEYGLMVAMRAAIVLAIKELTTEFPWYDEANDRYIL